VAMMTSIGVVFELGDLAAQVFDLGDDVAVY